MTAGAFHEKALLIPPRLISPRLLESQKAVAYIAVVHVHPSYRPGWVDRQGDGALKGACACARKIELCELSVRGPDEAVIHVVCVVVIPHDRPGVVDVLRPSPQVGVGRADGQLILRRLDRGGFPAL